jgi:DNA-binding CsgD family transcriptional regulator
MAVGEYNKFIPQLTRRELEVIEAVLAGSLRYKSISSSLNISVNTVKTHLKKIYLTVGVNNVEALAALFHGYSRNKEEITPKSPSKIAKSPQMGDKKQHFLAVIFYNIKLNFVQQHSGGKKMQNLKALRIRKVFTISLVSVIALVIGFSAVKLVSENRQTGLEIGKKAETVPEGILVNFKEVLAIGYAYNGNGELTGYDENEYDSNGNLTKISIYDAHGELLGYNKYEYDSKGNRTKQSIYDANRDLSGYELSSYNGYEYDSKSNPTKIRNYNANGELSGYDEFEYDSKGNRTKNSSYNANGELSSYFEIGYDSNGNWAKTSNYNANGKLSDYYEFEYDSNGNETKNSSYNSNGKLSSCLEIDYDSNGHQTKYRCYNADGELIDYLTFEYDSNGNRTKSSRYNTNGELVDYEVLVYKSIATGKNKVSDFPDIEISAVTVPEGILVTFSDYSNIPMEIENLKIAFTDWDNIEDPDWENDDPLVFMNTMRNIHTSQTWENVIEQVRQTGTVTFPFVQPGRKYAISAVFYNGNDIVKSAKTECVANKGIYLNRNITLNMNNARTGFALSSKPVFTSDVQLEQIHYYIVIHKGVYTEAITSDKTNDLFWNFEPKFSKHLKEVGVPKGNYPAYTGASLNIIYDNISWLIEIAKTPVFTYSL